MDRVETVVVGAGVVGLAVARALAISGREVVIVERERAFGTGTSARNSEVIHAGLYYPPGSLKASLCIEGAARLYDFCRERHVPHRRCGKLIVACDVGEREALHSIAQRAAGCGGGPLQWLDRSRLAKMEPALRADTALLSANTGIVDSHAMMRALLADAEDQGATLAVVSEATGAEARKGGFLLRVASGQTESRLATRELVNAAGLGAQDLAARIDGLSPETIPPLHLAKGSYFATSGRVPFSRLVYPLPDSAGLGVHLTLDLAGQARFGPDVEWVSTVDYDVDARRAAAFEEQVRRYWPSLPNQSLQPAYSGIRPKLVGPGETAADFRIDGPEVSGIPGLVCLYGIESPGLTASLAIADRVVAALELR
ncbi:MAG: NAD(P)/FAD-dependent oxidoreductase [Burkholderiaceae bacterium]|jgi:L-2-hydroxyglutarate oxidase LhgO|nr:NAD(P)/FAD-dependent oxidoreductase [Burkholderiaceae bacterium]